MITGSYKKTHKVAKERVPWDNGVKKILTELYTIYVFNIINIYCIYSYIT